MAQSQLQVPVLSQNVQEPTQAQDYSYLVNVLKDHSNLIKDLQRDVASLNVRLEILERNNVVQEMVHENINSTENIISNLGKDALNKTVHENVKSTESVKSTVKDKVISKNACVKANPNECETSSDKESENKNAHKNSTPNEGGFKKISSNENKKSTKDPKVCTIAGVNLNQNRFSELSNVDIIK